MAAGSMLLSGCKQDNAALKEFQKNALETKLEQMGPDAADAYIRNQMNGVKRVRIESMPINVPTTDGGLKTIPVPKVVSDGTFLDYWTEHDTNGTLVDEYVNYAMSKLGVEKEIKAQAKAEFNHLSKTPKPVEMER